MPLRDEAFLSWYVATWMAATPNTELDNSLFLSLYIYNYIYVYLYGALFFILHLL